MQYYYRKYYCKIAVPSLCYEFQTLEAIYDLLISQAYSINGSTLDGTMNTYNKIVHRDLKTNPVNIDLKASILQYEN